MAVRLAGFNGASGGPRQRFTSVWALLAAAISCAVLYAVSGPSPMKLAAAIAALTFVFLIFGLHIRQIVAARTERRRATHLVALVGQDATPCYMTDAHGQILYQNDSAVGRFGAASGATMV